MVELGVRHCVGYLIFAAHIIFLEPLCVLQVLPPPSFSFKLCP